jgi:hypothetical protein
MDVTKILELKKRIELIKNASLNNNMKISKNISLKKNITLEEITKQILTLIDDSIEEDDYYEAFFIFIKFVKDLDNETRDYVFEKYYKLLNP